MKKTFDLSQYEMPASTKNNIKRGLRKRMDI